jgi:hypothetical protein
MLLLRKFGQEQTAYTRNHIVITSLAQVKKYLIRKNKEVAILEYISNSFRDVSSMHNRSIREMNYNLINVTINFLALTQSLLVIIQLQLTVFHIYACCSMTTIFPFAAYSMFKLNNPIRNVSFPSSKRLRAPNSVPRFRSYIVLCVYFYGFPKVCLYLFLFLWGMYSM